MADTEAAGLRAWCAHTASRFRDVGADDKAEALAEVVEALIAERKRQRNERPGTLKRLEKLKVAVRLAGALLEATQREQPHAMRGWRFRQKPLNEVQALYEELYRIAMLLGFAIAEIESEFPEHRAYFEAERAEYRRKCAELEEQIKIVMPGAHTTRQASR